jgi:hypothetical protein
VLLRVPGATCGGKRRKEMISIEWVASDGSKFPITDVEITLPYSTLFVGVSKLPHLTRVGMAVIIILGNVESSLPI